MKQIITKTTSASSIIMIYLKDNNLCTNIRLNCIKLYLQRSYATFINVMKKQYTIEIGIKKTLKDFCAIVQFMIQIETFKWLKVQV